MPTELSHLIERISAQFGATPDRVQIHPIRHGWFERNNVWRLTVAGGTYLLKQHLITRPIGESAFTPFQIESAVLSTLHQAGCSVPRIVWKSDRDLCLLLEWCGGATLDDLAQEKPIEALKSVARNVVREFCRTEKAFANHAHAVTPYVYPLDYPAFLHRTMQAIQDRGKKTMSYIAQLNGEPVTPDRQAIIDELWSHLSNRLRDAVTTLGALDYNARNVVVDGEKPTFIDFASVGWDWGERRLVQLLNSLGAHRTDGNFVNLLDREVVESYSIEVANYREDMLSRCGVLRLRPGTPSVSEIAAQVDYHHLLFYLSAIYRLLQAVAQPDMAENQALLKAWGNAKARLHRAIDLLADSRLSDDRYALQIRALIAEFRRKP